ncbi:MAG: hypothetical protein E6J71_03190 [Deltaproteobacteria bacterium]|nr:MAG: hypothetical protein E6J71_03190 [Deltaproteobacteria bacterium]
MSRITITAGHALASVTHVPLGHLAEAVQARAARSERITALTLAAAGAALAAAGLVSDPAASPSPRIGVVLGTAFGCFLTNAAYQDRLADGGPPAASPRLFAATVSNAAAGELAIAYRLAGPGVTLTAGAASGLAALGHATDLLRAGQADALVAGGVDALGAPLTRWLAEGGLNCGRPPAEAVALLVLEEPTFARARAAPVLGAVLGHASGFEPEPADGTAGDGLAGAVSAALEEADVQPGDLALAVSAAPPALAGLESRALAAALGRARPRIVSPKDTYGETFGAAGPLALLTALAEAPGGAPVLVLDVCASGHVGALLAESAST